MSHVRCSTTPAAVAGMVLLGLVRCGMADVIMLEDKAGSNNQGECNSKLMQGKLDIGGAGGSLFMASPSADFGQAIGDRLTVKHNAGFTAFSACEDEWAPNSIAQFQLLGRSMGFTVDLSDVGCACNLAFYLISSPALDTDGHPSEGTDRGGQPPYYCDANMVGGQWCPEIDIMEANDHSFQSTLHKCDAPVQGHYSYCDRSGCAQSTNDKHGSYGPGSRFTINTLEPFRVETEFPEDGGVLVGMRAVLRQNGRTVELAHQACDPEYLAALSEAMKVGMSLRITYWGGSAQTMAWMDSPPCGPEECSSDNAGDAVISNLTVSPRHPLSYYREHGFKPAEASTTVLGGNQWWSPPATEAPTSEGGNPWWSPPTQAPAFAGPATWIPDTSSPFECHQYTGNQQETNWCATSGIQDGFQFVYNGGQNSPCGGCWCCKRRAKQVSSMGEDVVWIVSDVKDPLHGQMVPHETMADAAASVKMSDRGIVLWRGDKHFVKLVVRGANGEPCLDASCEVAMINTADSMSVVMRKFAASPRLAFATLGRQHALGVITGLVAFALVVGAVAFGTRRLRLRRSADQTTGPAPQEPSPSACADRGAGGLGAVAFASSFHASPMRKRNSATNLAAQPFAIRRSNSSCQKLLPSASLASMELDA